MFNLKSVELIFHEQKLFNKIKRFLNQKKLKQKIAFVFSLFLFSGTDVRMN